VMINTHISPAVRQLGLKGSGGRYAVPSATHWMLVGFQKSAYSDQQSIRFTVNLLVVRRDVWAQQVAERPYLGVRPSASTHYGFWAPSARLSMLRAGVDQWWTLEPITDVGQLVGEITREFVALGLPWLRQHVEQDADSSS